MLDALVGDAPSEVKTTIKKEDCVREVVKESLLQTIPIYGFVKSAINAAKGKSSLVWEFFDNGQNFPLLLCYSNHAATIIGAGLIIDYYFF